MLWLEFYIFYVKTVSLLKLDEYEPDRYHILSETIYEDSACSPRSWLERPGPNSPVQCTFTGIITNRDRQPENGAYMLNGTSQMQVAERWIEFEFIFLHRLILTHVTLHYYCTGSPPEFQLTDQSNVVTPCEPVTPSCSESVLLQHLNISFYRDSTNVSLVVRRNGGLFGLTEMDFIFMSPRGKNEVNRIHTDKSIMSSAS